MSSTYRVLCLSHDPATVIGSQEFSQREGAEQAIRDGIPGHPECDLLIGAFSYPLVEVGCPSDTHPVMRHRGTEWIDAAWLRLLHHAYQDAVPPTWLRLGQHPFDCWTRDRLARLRTELDIPTSKDPT